MNNLKIFTALITLAACCSIISAEIPNSDDIMKDVHLHNESFEIEKKYIKSNKPWKEESEFKQCAKNGNHYCQLALGNLYYNEKNYSAALDMYLACSDKMGNVINAIIGEMYLHGKGTIQDFDKSIHYLKLSVFDKGMPYFIKAQDSALISHAYDKKSYLGLISKSTIATDSFRYNEIRSYAWGKVAQSLGYKEYIYENGSVVPLTKYLLMRQEILAKNGWLNEANKLATEYRSKINDVMQK